MRVHSSWDFFHCLASCLRAGESASQNTASRALYLSIRKTSPLCYHGLSVHTECSNICPWPLFHHQLCLWLNQAITMSSYTPGSRTSSQCTSNDKAWLTLFQFSHFSFLELLFIRNWPGLSSVGGGIIVSFLYFFFLLFFFAEAEL